MILTTDFHTHILPEIDDGSQSVEDSVAMICKERTDGVNNIFLTPHFYPQQMYPELFVENRQQAMDKLVCATPNAFKKMQFVLGAEVLFCPGMSQWEKLESLTLGNTKHILIEMPFHRWSESTFAELKNIYSERGLTPILAHIERYLPPWGINSFLRRLNKLPVILQSNCDFITNKRTQHLALKLIKEQKIHLIGSDCHSSSWRTPNMSQAREILIRNLDKQTIRFLEQFENLVIQK